MKSIVGLLFVLTLLALLLYNFYPASIIGVLLDSYNIRIVPYLWYIKLWPLPLLFIFLQVTFYQNQAIYNLSRYPVEHHPYLRFMNGATYVVGYFLAFLAFGTIRNITYITNELQFGLGILLLSVGIYTELFTDRFQHWDEGLTPMKKVIGWLSVLAGFLLSFWLILLVIGFLSAGKEERR